MLAFYRMWLFRKARDFLFSRQVDILSAAVVLSGSILVSRVLGLGRGRALAHYFFCNDISIFSPAFLGGGRPRIQSRRDHTDGSANAGASAHPGAVRYFLLSDRNPEVLPAVSGTGLGAGLLQSVNHSWNRVPF